MEWLVVYCTTLSVSLFSVICCSAAVAFSRIACRSRQMVKAAAGENNTEMGFKRKLECTESLCGRIKKENKDLQMNKLFIFPSALLSKQCLENKNLGIVNLQNYEISFAWRCRGSFSSPSVPPLCIWLHSVLLFTLTPDFQNPFNGPVTRGINCNGKGQA